jgi:hypothetical protein
LVIAHSKSILIQNIQTTSNVENHFYINVSVNGDARGDCPVWRFEIGKFFPVRMGI